MSTRTQNVIFQYTQKIPYVRRALQSHPPEELIDRVDGFGDILDALDELEPEPSALASGPIVKDADARLSGVVSKIINSGGVESDLTMRDVVRYTLDGGLVVSNGSNNSHDDAIGATRLQVKAFGFESALLVFNPLDMTQYVAGNMVQLSEVPIAKHLIIQTVSSAVNESGGTGSITSTHSHGFYPVSMAQQIPDDPEAVTNSRNMFLVPLAIQRYMQVALDNKLQGRGRNTHVGRTIDPTREVTVANIQPDFQAAFPEDVELPGIGHRLDTMPLTGAPGILAALTQYMEGAGIPNPEQLIDQKHDVRKMEVVGENVIGSDGEPLPGVADGPGLVATNEQMIEKYKEEVQRERERDKDLNGPDGEVN